MKYFLDTSICVDVLRTNGPQKSFELFESFSDDKNTGIISVITVAELSAGAALSPLKDAQKKTDELLMFRLSDSMSPLPLRAEKFMHNSQKPERKLNSMTA